jgi:hypothetical protein
LWVLGHLWYFPGLEPGVWVFQIWCPAGVWPRIKEPPNTDLNPQWRAKKSGLPRNVHKRLGSWNYKCLWIPMGLALFFYHSSTTPRSVFMAMGAPTGGSQYLFELQRQLSYVQGF